MLAKVSLNIIDINKLNLFKWGSQPPITLLSVAASSTPSLAAPRISSSNAPASSERNNLESLFENSCSDIPTYITRKPQQSGVSFVSIPSQLNTYGMHHSWYQSDFPQALKSILITTK